MRTHGIDNEPVAGSRYDGWCMCQRKRTRARLIPSHRYERSVAAEVRVLGDDDDPFGGDVEALAVAVEVVADLRPRRDLDVLVDDRAAHARVAADAHAVEEDRVFDEREGVHAH